MFYFVKMELRRLNIQNIWIWAYFPLVSFFSVVIEEANWLSLSEDIQKPGEGFDAVICLGNSFAHLPDFKGTVTYFHSVFELGRQNTDVVF